MATPSHESSAGTTFSVITTSRLLLLVLLSPLSLTWAKERVYYLAAVEVDWDYAPKGGHTTNVAYNAEFYLKSGMNRIGSIYKKTVYRLYNNEKFEEELPMKSWQGIVGAIMRAEVGDTLYIKFHNMASKPFSVHPHGALYDKIKEGAVYKGKEPQKGAKVPPGGMFEYTWYIDEVTGPAQGDDACIPWPFHSHGEDPEKDINTGLIGVLLVCKEGILNDEDMRKDVQQEFVVLLKVFNENHSWHTYENLKWCGKNGNCKKLLEKGDEDFKASNYMHALNGYMYAHGAPFIACGGDNVVWHVLGFGGELDLHSFTVDGEVITLGPERVISAEVMPGTFVSVAMTATTVGKKLTFCAVSSHFEEGMSAFLEVHDCGVALPAAQVAKTRKFYLAIEEVVWDYAPSGMDMYDGSPLKGEGSSPKKSKYFEEGHGKIGGAYKKLMYYGYKDADFKEKLPRYASDKHLGYLGPVIRVEGNDVLEVVLWNKGPKPFSFFPYGLFPADPKKVDKGGLHNKPVYPGNKHTYIFAVPPGGPPVLGAPPCSTSMYHSAVDPVRDIHSGLVGALLICKKDWIDSEGNQKEGEERVLFTSVVDENLSWLIDVNVKQKAGSARVDRHDKEFWASNQMHSINGLMYGNMEGLEFCKWTKVFWHVFALGDETDVQGIHFHGLNFETEGRISDTVPLFPGKTNTLQTKVSEEGKYVIQVTNTDHFEAGMFVMYKVSDACDHYGRRRRAANLTFTTTVADAISANNSSTHQLHSDRNDDHVHDDGDGDDKSDDAEGDDDNIETGRSVHRHRHHDNVHGEDFIINPTDDPHDDDIDDTADERSVPEHAPYVNDDERGFDSVTDEDGASAAAAKTTDAENVSDKDERRVHGRLPHQEQGSNHDNAGRETDPLDYVALENFLGDLRKDTDSLGNPGKDTGSVRDLEKGTELLGDPVKEPDSQYNPEKESDYVYNLKAGHYHPKLLAYAMATRAAAKCKETSARSSCSEILGQTTPPSGITTQSMSTFGSDFDRMDNHQTAKNSENQQTHFPNTTESRQRKMSADPKVSKNSTSESSYDHTYQEDYHIKNDQNHASHMQDTADKIRNGSTGVDITPRIDTNNDTEETDEISDGITNERTASDRKMLVSSKNNTTGAYKQFRNGTMVVNLSPNSNSSSSSLLVYQDGFERPVPHPYKGEVEGEKKKKKKKKKKKVAVRQYFIAAEEINWDYTPDWAALVKSGDRRKRSGTESTVYLKAVYRQYTDKTFTRPVPREKADKHLGLIGPFIRVQEGEKLEIYFLNKASKPYSVYAHMLAADKENEGASYKDESGLSKDDKVLPGETYVYRYKVTVPEQQASPCFSSLYYSSHSYPKDMYSGLVGPLIICRKGTLNEQGVRGDVQREYALLFAVFDENQSKYAGENKKQGALGSSNKFHSINGFTSSHVPGLEMVKDDVIAWHVMTFGSSHDIHSVNFHGQPVVMEAGGPHVIDTVGIMPEVSKDLLMTAVMPGDWMIHCDVNGHTKAGEITTYTVKGHLDPAEIKVKPVAKPVPLEKQLELIKLAAKEQAKAAAIAEAQAALAAAAQQEAAIAAAAQAAAAEAQAAVLDAQAAKAAAAAEGALLGQKAALPKIKKLQKKAEKKAAKAEKIAELKVDAAAEAAKEAKDKVNALNNAGLKPVIIKGGGGGGGEEPEEQEEEYYYYEDEEEEANEEEVKVEEQQEEEWGWEYEGGEEGGGGEEYEEEGGEWEEEEWGDWGGEEYEGEEETSANLEELGGKWGDESKWDEQGEWEVGGSAGEEGGGSYDYGEEEEWEEEGEEEGGGEGGYDDYSDYGSESEGWESSYDSGEDEGGDYESSDHYGSSEDSSSYDHYSEY